MVPGKVAGRRIIIFLFHRERKSPAALAGALAAQSLGVRPLVAGGHFEGWPTMTLLFTRAATATGGLLGSQPLAREGLQG